MSFPVVESYRAIALFVDEAGQITSPVPGPAGPSGQVGPVGQVAPTSPRGITKSNIASLVVPTFVTLAFVPGEPVVVVHTVAVALSPVSPFKSLLRPFLVTPHDTKGIKSVFTGTQVGSSDIFTFASAIEL